MTERTCITWEMQDAHPADRPRTCSRRDLHYAGCPDEDTCSGCVPRTARHGYLCDSCWYKAMDMLNRIEEIIAHLRSVEQTGNAVGERVDTSRTPQLPIPQTWQVADELLEALGIRPIPAEYGINASIRYVNARVGIIRLDPAAFANTVTGALALVRGTLRMQTALKRFPATEVAVRQIPYVLCPDCKQQTLQRRAPLAYRDEIQVTCANPSCRYRFDWFEWLEVYKPIIAHLFTEKHGIAL